MQIHGENLQPNQYEIADRGDGLNQLVVLPVREQAGLALTQLAISYQAVMREAWTEQFKDKYTPEQIKFTASEYDDLLIREQRVKLKYCNQPGSPAYEYAVLLEAGEYHGANSPLVGIGKGTMVDGRRMSSLRLGTPPIEKQLADVSNIFVRPKHMVRKGSSTAAMDKLPRAQGRGVGRALLHNLLDAYPDDINTVVYDFEWNEQVDAILTGPLRFTVRKSWDKPYFGRIVQQAMYDGPTVGELRSILEQTSPSLANRQPLEVRA